MKKIKSVLVLILIFTTSLSFGQKLTSEFLGMWSIDIEGGSVGWLEVYNNNGFLDANLLWVGGSVSPISYIYFIDDNNLVVTRSYEHIKSKGTNNERIYTITQTFNIKRNGDKISGFRLDPSRDGAGVKETKFTGWKLPDIGKAPDLLKIKYGKPISLLNSKNLIGWKLIDPEKTNGFSMVDGVLINNPVPIEGKKIHYGNLRTEKEFKDFNLKLEVNVPQHSNSGVYLRGIYEIQVRDSYGEELDSHNMGGLYSRITPSQAAEKPAGEWQTMVWARLRV